MAQNLIDRTLQTLSLMATEVDGISVTELSQRIGLPKGGAHRLLNELVRLDYVRQDPISERYILTTRLISIGLAFLSASGVTDVMQPILDRLAEESGELVRLTVVDGNQLTWVAKAQGARAGLRYDPEMGGHPKLHCTATGQSWLASMTNEEALMLAAKEGFGKLSEHGPNAPRTVAALLEALELARTHGYAHVDQAAEAGTAAIAAVICHPRTGDAVGTVSIAGPSSRLTGSRAKDLVPRLISAARELELASISAPTLLGPRRLKANN
jgi:IclR family transcriptional regulator, acetate operon repressor